MIDSNKKEAIIELLKKGYNIIPLKGGNDITSVDYKKPLINWSKYQTRISTLSEVHLWETNVFGIVTGSLSKLLVLDIDYDILIPVLKDDAKSIKIKTNRGWHIYYKWVSELDTKITTKTNIMENADIRGEGGYVVCWNTYLPDITELSPPPQWLIDLLPNKEKKLESGWVDKTLQEIKEGNRNDTFTRLAGSLRARGYSSGVIFDLLRSKGIEIGLSEQEVKTICKSVGRYRQGTGSSESSSIDNFLKQNSIVEWLVPTILAKQSIGFVAGLPETMKTWLMMDLAIEISRGGVWLGKFKANKGKVLFIDQERFKGETQRRFKAILNEKEIDPKILEDQLYIKCETTIRIDLQQSFDAFKKELFELQPDLVIIDSFATFHTKEENSRTEIQVVLERIKQLRNETKCTFLFIDHENKGVFHDRETEEQPSAMRMVGSVAKVASAETIFTVRRNDINSSFVYHTKSTLSSTIAPFLVKVTDKNLEKTSISVEAF